MGGVWYFLPFYVCCFRNERSGYDAFCFDVSAYGPAPQDFGAANDDLCDKDIVELIIAKGLPGDPEVIKMLSPSYITCLFECTSENEQ